jgi:hypothetical protein
MNTKRSFRQTNHKVHRTVSADFILPLIIAGCLTIAAHTANAATYYLDAANGNDSDSGTSEHPWKTMARAMTNWTGAGTKVAFGDTVYLRTGNYGIADFNFSPAISPSSWADAITYKAETGQLPVFSYLHIDRELSRYLIFDGISVTRTSEVVANVQACILVHSPSSLQFRNMNITGHWDTVVGGLLTTYGIQIDTVTVLQKQSDILIEDCNITNVAQGIYLNGGIVGSNIIIRNNIVHHTSNSSISIGSNTRTDEPNVILVESNYVYGPESIPQWYTVTHSNSIIGTFNNHERVTQDITGAIGKISEITTSSVTITPLSDGWTMGADYDIVGDVTGARLSDPNAITHTELTHASGIGLTTDNVTVRGNIIRNYAATSPLHTYPGWITVAKDGHKGYNNITIENNLVYDPFSANTTLLEEINSNCVIRNNTFIGYNLNPPNLSGYYYRSAFRLEQLPGSTGTKIYNNLIVGMAELSTTYPIVDVNQATKTFSVSGDHSADFISGSYLIVDSGGANSGTYHINGNAIYDGTNTLVVVSEAIPSATVAGSLKIPIPSTDYDEDYNLIYAVSSGGRWSSLLKGTHTQILSNGTTNPKTFDTGYFVNPNFSYSHGLVCDYRLQAGASAINFGDPNNQPSDSLGTVGPDGFIRDDGPAREATHHSAGCYEYKPVYFPLSITKCTVTAGSKTVGGNVINSDRISISGDMNAVADDFNDTNAFKVTVDSNYIVSPCVQTFTVINGKTFKNSKYSYSGTDGNGVRKSFSYNPKTQKFSFSANSVDLSGLDCLVNTKIEIGDFNAMGDANETIVNGAKTPIPIKLMTGVKNVLRVDKCTVKHGKKPASDILSARGAFAVEDTDANMTDRISDDLVVTLDTQQFTIPANKLKAGRGYFTCSRADVNEGGIHAGTAAATFNFNLCSFILTIKDANIPPPVSGDVDFSVSFADFNEVDRITFL